MSRVSGLVWRQKPKKLKENKRKKKKKSKEEMKNQSLKKKNYFLVDNFYSVGAIKSRFWIKNLFI